MLRINVVTLFPDLFEPFTRLGIVHRAMRKGAVELKTVDIRSFAVDKHGTVDDTPYGGGAGMILRPEPIVNAVRSITESSPDGVGRLLMMTPQGETYDQYKAFDYSKEKCITIISGHYKGFDERIREILSPEEISIGDFVLSGGETAALVIIDSVVRLLPGVLGNFDSAKGDSFFSGLLDCPWYTRPEEFEGIRVPEVLISGNHALIEEWRRAKALERTQERRPDLAADIVGKQMAKFGKQN